MFINITKPFDVSYSKGLVDCSLTYPMQAIWAHENGKVSLAAWVMMPWCRRVH